jgi:DNA primase
MELNEIKALLSIGTVLEHYSLKPDKNHRLHCPFHPDKTPSLQIYPQTNTFCCFSSNCAASTGDQIQFIELMEKCTKHEALLRATSLINSNMPSTAPQNPAKIFAEADFLEKAALMTKLFLYFKKSLPLTRKAVDYLETRAINYQAHEIGYNSGGLHGESKNHHLVSSMEKWGLLKHLPTRGHSVWAKDCIIFPLKNPDNKIISLYGRSIRDNDQSRHFYLQNREGLYPGYPKLTTKKLILTESNIDAASLLQQESIKSKYEILALYGTNGLTDEHIKAIQSLPELEEIILMLDADEAGEAATAKHAATLRELLPEIKISKVELPAGEDVNSVLCTHDDAGVLQNLIEERKEFFFSIENKKSETITTPVMPTGSKLIATNPELLIFDNCELHIEVLGGIRITGLDRMKVTLKVLHKEKTVLPLWHSLDLYNHVQRELAINNIAETFEVGTQATTNTIAHLTSELERYRVQRIESLQPRAEQQPEMSAAQRQTAINELKKPNLLARTSQLIAMSGIVAETTNSLIAYLVYSTRKQQVPLHVMFLGTSASGKTYLQERISELIPEEDRIQITQITENALYYFRQHELRNKLILIEDLDGAAGVLYPLRELQTKRRISKTVTLKDSKGNLKTITLTVEGPVSVSGCTTKEKIYDDNANRCILLYTDTSTGQDKRINEYQGRLAAGEVNRERETQLRELFKNMQRMLRPIHIINPYAKFIQLPAQVFKPRRTMTLLLGFIEAVTFYHQYQREVKKDNNGQPYIETTASDIQTAFNLLKDVLFSKSDELTKATRDFLEQLKQYLQSNNLQSFTAQQIRKAFRIEPRTIQRYIRELKQYGFIKPVSGFKRRIGFEYSIADAAEYTNLKTEIDSHLQAILEKLRQ